MTEDAVGDFPQAKGREFGRAVVKAAMSAVPLAGDPLAELLDVVFRPALEDRQAAWLGQLADAVNDLKARAIDLEDVASDPSFVTATIEASRIALGTHLEEKLAMLKACIVNMALPGAPEDFLAMRFLRFVEELSPEHFLVLTYSRDPAKWYATHGLQVKDFYTAPRSQALDEARIVADATNRELVVADLTSRRLANGDMISGGVTSASVYGPWIAPLGSQLLDFVTLI